MLIFRQLFELQSSTYTYLLADSETREAVIIDPVFEELRRDAALINELGLKLLFTLETHVHADHVTAAWLMKRRLGARIALSAKSGANGADRFLAEGDEIAFGSHCLAVRETPGHTSGCLTYVLNGGERAFTGDCLLIRGSGRTDFQHGDAQTMYRSVRERIFSLPPSCLLYPAHDYRGLTVTSVDEEQRFNPRLGGGASAEDFCGHMANLKLAHPKKIDIAVPANLACGRQAQDVAAGADPGWAPLTFTFAGLWEITPLALEEHQGPVQILDVREPSEFCGPLGHISGAILIPLAELKERIGELRRDRPVVAVCRSGSRSAQAVTLLLRESFVDVANLAGGMLRWRTEGREAVGATG